MTGGYDQIGTTVDAYLDKEKFLFLPDKPQSPYLVSGQQVDLVSFSEGIVRATPGYDAIKRLPSFVILETHGVGPGYKVSPTVDLATDIGSVILMNADEDVLRRDIAAIRQLEKDDKMFEYEEDNEQPCPTMRVAQKSNCSLGFDSLPVIQVSTDIGHRRMVSRDSPDMFVQC